MLNLFDSYNEQTKILHESIQKTGMKIPTIVISNDGFLPETVLSPFRFFYNQDPNARPLYFNELKLPDFWEVKATVKNAEIFDKNRKRGIIHYYPSETRNRLVKSVSWLNEKGKEFLVEHYDAQGFLFKKSVYNQGLNKQSDIYLDENGYERVIENLTDHSILLLDKSGPQYFPNRTEFVLYFINKYDLLSDHIIINSLSTPFFVSNRLGDKVGKILFWQEPIGEKVPGNMLHLISEDKGNYHIFFQSQHNLAKFKEKFVDSISPNASLLGNVYEFSNEKTLISVPEVFISTYSDAIENIEEITNQLPELIFHIAAPTLMSDKLNQLGNKKNVHLYPTANKILTEKILKKSSVYLDINHDREVEGIIQKAFTLNKPILAFNSTVHRKDFVLETNIFHSTDGDGFCIRLKEILANTETYEEIIELQRKNGIAVSKEEFKDAIGKVVKNWNINLKS